MSQLILGIGPNGNPNAIRITAEGDLRILADGADGGTALLTAATTNYLVTTTNMKVGAYTVAAQPKGSHIVTVTHTRVGTKDTLGVIRVVGTDSYGNAITEDITPLDNTIAYGTLGFETITSITGVGWVIAGSDNDTLVVGVGAVKAPSGMFIYAVKALVDTVIAAQTYVDGYASPKLSSFTKIPAGAEVYGHWATVTLTSGEAVCYYKNS